MDEKDLLILKKLQEDASKPVKKIAKELDMPRSTVHDRIKKLISDGTIKRYTIAVDNKKLGNPITIFLFVSYQPNKELTQRELARKLSRLEGVAELYIVGGEWDLLLKIRGNSIDQLGELVVDSIRQTKGVEKTLTVTSFGVVKEELG